LLEKFEAMVEEFKNWLTESGKASEWSVYLDSMDRLSLHYSEQIGSEFDIFELEDGRELSKLLRLYAKKGKFSNVGDEGGGSVRSALAHYVKFRSQRNLAKQNEILMLAVEDFCLDISRDEVLKYRNEVQEYCAQLPSAIPKNHGIELSSPSMRFTYERDLQQLLCMQVTELFPEYEIFGGAKVGIEYQIGTRKIDVLLENKTDKSLLVVELKSGLADFKVFGQIAMYMGLVSREFCDRNVEGAIVAGEIDDSLIQATETNGLVKLLTYQVGITLKEA
ncbi:endonuclease NucS, partial [Vibrio sp. ZSDZ65]